LHLPLFDLATASDQISPRDLSTSRLIELSDCVTDIATASCFRSSSKWEDAGQPDFSASAGQMRQARVFHTKQLKLSKQISEIDRLTFELLNKHIMDIQELRTNHAADMETVLRIVGESVGDVASERANRLADMYLHIHSALEIFQSELKTFVPDTSTLQAGGADQFKRFSKFMEGWTSFLSNDFSQFRYSLLRCNALNHCALYRRLEEAADAPMHAKLQQARRDAINIAKSAMQ
jgi:hypothetical protein